MYETLHGQHPLIGSTVTDIWWSENRLTFTTDRGPITFEVEGDCCSHSYFHDFFGVSHILNNGPITEFTPVDLQPGDPGHPKPALYPGDQDASNVFEALNEPEDDYADHIQVYGYRITTEHPQFGPVSSAFAFRNASNGYYGGYMLLADDPSIHEDQKQITNDIVGD
jgi:hypothetical protein